MWQAVRFLTGPPPIQPCKENAMKILILPSLLLLLLPSYEVMAGETTFVNGARPWNFSPRSRENHLTMQMRGPDASREATAGNVAGLTGYPGVTYSSQSTAIGNWIQVEMTLGDGSEGLVMIENDQTNNGDQQSLSDILGEIIETYQADYLTGEITE